MAAVNRPTARAEPTTIESNRVVTKKIALPSRRTGAEAPPSCAADLGAGSGRSSRDASIGIRVSATISDTTNEKATVRAWSRKSWAATPSTKTIGTKTQMVVRVEAVIARPTSEVPTRAASTSSSPSSRLRCTASRTTMALSTNRPTPRVRPPNDMMLSEISATYMRKKVAITDTGIETEMMRVFLSERRKKKSTTIASRPP